VALTDITERKIAEEALVETKEELEKDRSGPSNCKRLMMKLFSQGSPQGLDVSSSLVRQIVVKSQPGLVKPFFRKSAMI
jgi:hypothetical protein